MLRALVTATFYEIEEENGRLVVKAFRLKAGEIFRLHEENHEELLIKHKWAKKTEPFPHPILNKKPSDDKGDGKKTNKRKRRTKKSEKVEINGSDCERYCK